MTNKPIRKAVFPVAGLGTRILPATKSMPKEMLTIVDRPLIQYAMDEAREAGIEHFIFVTGRGKSALEDHFDHAFELEATLAARGKSDAPLAATRYTPGSISYVRQQQPLGLGHAVWCAREMIGDEPFAVLLPDDLMRGTTGCLSQMMTAYDQMGGNIICVQEVGADETNKYGIINPALRNDRVTRIQGLVEKPAPADAPSNLAIVGRYIIQPEVMDVLSNQATGAGGEIQLTDALAAMIGDGNFHGLTFDGVRYDCGDKLGFVRANIGVAMEDASLRAGLSDMMTTARSAELSPSSRSGHNMAAEESIRQLRRA